MGGQREDKGRGSRWGGRDGGGDVCQGGWLGSTLAGAEGRKKVSQAFLISLYPFISLCLFLSPRFHTASGLTLSFFFSFQHHCWIPHIASLSPSCPGSICPLICHHSFHTSLSPLNTFFPLLPFCVCFNHPLIAPSFHGERCLA